MGNYKVGDKVRSLACKAIGEIGTVKAINTGCVGDAVGVEFDSYVGGHDGNSFFAGKQGHCWIFDKCNIELVNPQSIHITTDGNTVHAVLKDSGKVIKRSKAVCAPSDTFDFETGARIAFDRLCTSLAENSKFSEPQAENKPAEPINLYCVKSFRSGEFLTNGKTYTIEKDGAVITYDDGWKTRLKLDRDCLDGVKIVPNYLVPEVKRPAKIGEYIKVTVPSDVRDGRYEVGDILRVIYDDSNITEQWVGAAVGFENITRPERPWQYCVIRNNNYVVLDGYKPEADNLTIDIKEAFAEINKAIKADAKCTSCRRERINEAISTPKLDTKGIYAELERILKMAGI